jgi:hypothetical protein
MEAQISGSVQSRNAASAQIRSTMCRRSAATWQRAAVPLRAIRPARDFGRLRSGRLRFGMRQAEKAPGLLGDVGLKSIRPRAFADDVEQIAMLAGGGVGPFARRALAGESVQPHEHRAARRVADIADLPVIALAAAGER